MQNFSPTKVGKESAVYHQILKLLNLFIKLNRPSNYENIYFLGCGQILIDIMSVRQYNVFRSYIIIYVIKSIIQLRRVGKSLLFADTNYSSCFIKLVILFSLISILANLQLLQLQPSSGTLFLCTISPSYRRG